METVLTKWDFTIYERNLVGISGLVYSNGSQKIIQEVIFYNIFVILGFAKQFNGKAVIQDCYPNMKDKTIYFEVVFESQSDLKKFINTVQRRSR